MFFPTKKISILAVPGVHPQILGSSSAQHQCLVEDHWSKSLALHGTRGGLNQGKLDIKLDINLGKRYGRWMFFFWMGALKP